MSLSKTSLSLHNGNGSPVSDTLTVSFANAGNGVTFKAAQSGGSGDLIVAVVGNTITITSVAPSKANNHRGNFAVRVTPTNCGSPQDISVKVAN